MRITLRIQTALVLIAILFLSCEKKKVTTTEEEPANVFNKQAMLTNLADNLIIPGYVSFKKSLDSLVTVYNEFIVTETLNDFQQVKQKLNVVSIKYQRINLFGFGPGEEQNIRSNFNIFPTDTAKIKANCASGSYNLSSAANVDTKGLPALDYLFYGYNASEAALIQLFKTSPGRRTYVSNLLNDMTTKTNAVIENWKNTYRSTFINSLGTDVGSSIGFVINQMNYELDYLKNAKVATPLGLKSDGSPKPDNCEAYYGAQSLQYALETLNAIETIFQGKSLDGNNGLGFDDYLNHLGAKHSGGSLVTVIENQFTTARTKLSAIGNPLSQKVVSNSAAVNEAYKELVKLLVLLKTDTPSNLGVVITYQDGDGD